MKNRTREQASNTDDATQTASAGKPGADMQVVDTCTDLDDALARHDALLGKKKRSKRKKKDTLLNPLKENYPNPGFCMGTTKVDLDSVMTQDLDDALARHDALLGKKKRSRRKKKDTHMNPLEENYPKPGFCVGTTKVDLDRETTMPDLDNEFANVEEAPYRPFKKMKLPKNVGLDSEISQSVLGNETAKVEKAPMRPHKKKKLGKKVDLDSKVTQVDLDAERARPDLDYGTAKVEEAPHQTKKKNLRKKHCRAEVHLETAKAYHPEQYNSLLECNPLQQDSFPPVNIFSMSSEITESSVGAHLLEATSGKGENRKSCKVLCTLNKDVESVTIPEGSSRKKKRKKQIPSSKIVSAAAKVDSPEADNSLTECSRLLGDTLQPINMHSEKDSEITESNEDVHSRKEIDKENNNEQCCISSSSNKVRDSVAISEGSSVKKKKKKKKKRKMNQTTDVMKDNDLFVHVKSLESPTLVDSSLPDRDVSVPCPVENGNFSDPKMDLNIEKISDGQSQLENLLRPEDAVIDANKQDLMPCSSLAGATNAEAGLTIIRNNVYQTLSVIHCRRKLLVLDINGLLADIVSQGRHVRKPDATVSRKSVFKRPFYDDFLRFCFDRFDVGIWSSRVKPNVDKVLDFLMGNMRDKLLFCWDQSHCTRTKFNTLENAEKPLILKELRKLWEKCEPDLPWESGWYNESNTILLDDSPYKALCNPAHTAVFPHSYHHQHENDNSLGPGGDLRVYLEGLASANDVQEYIRRNPFGQEAISESNPSWKFYRKIIHTSSCKLNKVANKPDPRDKILTDSQGCY